MKRMECAYVGQQCANLLIECLKHDLKREPPADHTNATRVNASIKYTKQASTYVIRFVFEPQFEHF